jgi:hypothetical protein
VLNFLFKNCQAHISNFSFLSISNCSKNCYLVARLYPSTFADRRFRNEDSVFVMHEYSSGGQEGKSLKDFVISAS